MDRILELRARQRRRLLHLELTAYPRRTLGYLQPPLDPTQADAPRPPPEQRKQRAKKRLVALDLVEQVS